MRAIILVFLGLVAVTLPTIAFGVADNAEYAPGATAPDFPGAKPRKVETAPVKAVSAPAPVAVKAEVKAATKVAMKPIVEEPKDEPPADFAPEVKAKAKADAKRAKAKPAKDKKTVVQSKPKKAAVAAPKTVIKPQIVKVEANEEAIAAAKEAKVEPKAGKAEPAKIVSKVAAKAEFSKEGDVEKLKFTFSTPVAAAVFERFGYYWLVFYTDDKIEMPDIKKSKIFDAAKKVTAVKTTILGEQGNASVFSPLIFSLEMVKGAYAMAEKKDNSWEISFDSGIDFKPEGPLKLAEKPDGWQIDAKGLVDRITVKDDFTNDYIDVLPLSEAGFYPEKVTNAQFILEKTVQGLVIKPIGQVEIKSLEKDKLRIIKKGGAPAPVAAAANVELKKPDVPMRPIYAFKKWPQLKSDEYRKAENKTRMGSALDFGKFLFSQGLYSEAAVNLQGERGFEASFLTGASYYMLGRFEDALKVFDSLILPGDVDPDELLMWRAAANFELGQVDPSLAKPMDLGNFHLVKNIEDYPDEIHNRLIFSITEKMIADGKYDEAQKLIDAMPKSALETPSQNYMKYLQGKLYDGQKKQARAREIWAEVAKAATDRESQAKASYEVIIQDYNGGKIKIDEAIAKLNDIRILWRGDIFEYSLLGTLADLYARNSQPYEALKIYKEILSSFPNFPHNLMIANTMRDIYQAVVTNNFADKDKTFAAVTIYYEFEELKPPGAAGDQITLQLADALAKYDLLSDAIRILQKYAVNLTDLSQKAEIATRVAILQFLNNKPKEALQSLQDSVAPNLPNYLVQERRILQVRCLIEVGDIDKASSLLSSLPDEQANRFKADIYWKQKKWQELVDVYDLIGDKSDDDIMRIAVADVMLDDKKASVALNKKYAEQMAKGAYADSFDYITDTENVDFRNLNESLKLDKTTNLMQKYRERIKNSGLAAVTGKGAPPAVVKPAVVDKAPEAVKK